jgi:hypothetical protein
LTAILIHTFLSQRDLDGEECIKTKKGGE